MYCLQLQTRPRKDVTEAGKREHFWKRCLKATTSASFRRQCVREIRKIQLWRKLMMGAANLDICNVNWCLCLHVMFPVLIVNLLIMNHLNNKDFS